MKNKIEIEELFQNRSEHFDEAPSRAAWKKLEKRLDNHQRRNKLNFIRSLGMVAGVLLLTVFAFLFSTLGINQSEAGADQVVASLETITTTEVDPEAYKVVEFTLKYRDRMLNPIEEGEGDNELLVRNN